MAEERGSETESSTPVTLTVSDVKKLQETVETFQTVLGSISKADGESHQLEDSATSGPSCSGMSGTWRPGPSVVLPSSSCEHRRGMFMMGILN